MRCLWTGTTSFIHGRLSRWVRSSKAFASPAVGWKLMPDLVPFMPRVAKPPVSCLAPGDGDRVGSGSSNATHHSYIQEPAERQESPCSPSSACSLHPSSTPEASWVSPECLWLVGIQGSLFVPYYQVSCLSLRFLQVSSVSPQDKHAGPCALRAVVKALDLVTSRTPWNQEQRAQPREPLGQNWG